MNYSAYQYMDMNQRTPLRALSVAKTARMPWNNTLNLWTPRGETSVSSVHGTPKEPVLLASVACVTITLITPPVDLLGTVMMSMRKARLAQ